MTHRPVRRRLRCHPSTMKPKESHARPRRGSIRGDDGGGGGRLQVIGAEEDMAANSFVLEEDGLTGSLGCSTKRWASTPLIYCLITSWSLVRPWKRKIMTKALSPGELRRRQQTLSAHVLDRNPLGEMHKMPNLKGLRCMWAILSFRPGPE